MVNLAVILAVSSSLHQSQLAYSRPRVMLPVLGKPMVVRIMERLYRAGIQRYVVIVGEDEGAVAAYLNRQWLPNVEIDFVVQSPNSSLTRTLADVSRRYAEPFLVTSYNSFTHVNFPDRLLKRYQEVGDGLVLSGAPVSLSKFAPYAFAEMKDGLVVDILSTNAANPALPMLSNLAICGSDFVTFLSNLLVNTRVFSRQLMEVLRLYVQAGRPTYLAETAWLLPIEADYDLLTLNRQLLDDEQDTHILSELPSSVQVIPPVRIDPNVSVGQGAKLGPRVYLEAGCSVGHHSTLANTMVLQNAVISANSHIDDLIVSTRARITNPDNG